MNEFQKCLQAALTEHFGNGWAAAIAQIGNGYIIKVQHGVSETTIDLKEVPPGTRILTIWTFSPDGKCAYIRLPKELDFMSFAARLMLGNLMGQGLEMEMARV